MRVPRSPRGAVEPRIFVSSQQQVPGVASPTFLVRAQSDAPIAAAVRQAIMEVDANAPLMSIRTARERLALLTAQDRAIARLALAFGGVALTLAAIGLYGVLSYGVARRTSEIAVRIALGARPSRVIAMIVRETADVVAVGVLAGGALAFAGIALHRRQPVRRRAAGSGNVYRGSSRPSGCGRGRRLPAGAPGVEAEPVAALRSE